MRFPISTMLTTLLLAQAMQADAQAVRFTHNLDGTITDNQSGLIWLQGASCLGKASWEGARNLVNSLSDENDHGCNLSDGSNAGDWRLPRIDELDTLLASPPPGDFQDPNISNTFGDAQWSEGDAFFGVRSAASPPEVYWSSSVANCGAIGARVMHFFQGVSVGCAVREDEHYVWAVRGGCAVAGGGAPSVLDILSLMTATCPAEPGEFIWESRDINGDFLPDKRVAPPISTDAGETIEVWCVDSWFFLGDPSYQMYVIEDGERIPAGGCPYCRAGNGPITLQHAGDANGNGVIDCAITTKWVSTEGAFDNGEAVDCDNDGKKEQSEYIYTVATKKRVRRQFHLSKPIFESEAEVPNVLTPFPEPPAGSGPVGRLANSLSDLNQDGQVDAQDRIIFDDAFGSSLGDSEYDRRADLDGDGRVTLIDSEILSKIVVIDVRPMNEKNGIRPHRRGLTPVAILTTSTFDATSVNTSTVRFGPNGILEVHGQGHIEDADRDGDNDLVLHFRTADAGIPCGQISVSVSAETTSGQTIHGSDSINTLGCQ